MIQVSSTIELKFKLFYKKIIMTLMHLPIEQGDGYRMQMHSHYFIDLTHDISKTSCSWIAISIL